METDHFVKRPRTIEELRKPHMLEDERPSEIVADVELSAHDYENFTTDVLADRQFIADNAALCGEGKVFKCIFVHSRNRGAGVLVVPQNGAFVSWVAFI